MIESPLLNREKTAVPLRRPGLDPAPINGGFRFHIPQISVSKQFLKTHTNGLKNLLPWENVIVSAAAMNTATKAMVR